MSDVQVSTSPQNSTVIFYAPILVNNNLQISQGQTVILTTSELSATNPGTNVDSLIFTASTVEHGYFEDISSPGVSTTVFAQKRVSSGALKFITDGTGTPPSYGISVSDGILSIPSCAAIVTFTPTPAALSTTATNNTVRNAIIGSSVSGVIGLGFLGAKLGISYCVEQRLKKAFEGGETKAEKERAKFYNEVIKPIVTKIFEQVKTTSFY